MNSKKWGLTFLGVSLISLCIFAGINIIIDPFFHYHKPLSVLEYPMNDERYLNDGIARHFDYDAIIIGTSMTQNFKVSQMNALFGVEAVKLSSSGASFCETGDNIKRAFIYNPDIKMVVMSLDLSKINAEPDEMAYSDYPEYLYDNNPFNDVEYVINKEVFFRSFEAVNYTRAGNKTISRDDYQAFDQWKGHGKDVVLSTWSRMPEEENEYVLSSEDYRRIEDNIEQNICRIVKEHPDTEFYFFFPPYSICYWDTLVRTKQIGADSDMKKKTCGLLFENPNVHIYDFSDNVEIVEDLNNYSDVLHYSSAISDFIMQGMAEGENELLVSTYEAYFDELAKSYMNYDYSCIFE